MLLTPRMKHVAGTANRRISNPPEADCKYRMSKGGFATLSHFTGL
jgi:hypothetical protein